MGRLGRRSALSVLIILLSVILFPSVQAIRATPILKETTMSAPTPAAHKGLYWFQVGATVYPQVDVTGAEVDIRVENQTSPKDGSNPAFWVGIELPNNAFIQVGYEICCNTTGPQSFWEYFLPGTALNGTGVFLGADKGGPQLKENSWVHFSIVSAGTSWEAYVNNFLFGTINLQSNYGNATFAIAEVAGANNGGNIIQPVEFRNLGYRDTEARWTLSTAGEAVCGYGVGSDTYPGQFPYGTLSLPAHNNDWFAGSTSDLPDPQTTVPLETGTFLWPWITIQGQNGQTVETEVYGKPVTINLPFIIQITPTSRQQLKTWTLNGTPISQQELATLTGGSLFNITPDLANNITLKPIYVQQYYVLVNSTLGTAAGSGWYNIGSTLVATVTPTRIPKPSILGQLGVTSVLTAWSIHGSIIPIDPNGNAKIQVNAPIMITAIWKTDYGFLPDYCILIALALILAAGIYASTRRKEKSSSRKRKRGQA